ncbi:MAG: SAM-dependent DNA methyltransferase, partial [Anaerolineales bacterium]|nr:SAM-dependent DNA methyltransferase [Anaerolineales bacterium]
MPSKQHTFGQYETPTDVADLLLGFCLRRPTDRVLDPSCGRGALLRRAARWQQWLAATPPPRPFATLAGVEVDPDALAAARAALPHAALHLQNFFTLPPDPRALFDAVVGNPPYTRAEWLDALAQESAAQLAFDWAAPPAAAAGNQLVPAPLWQQLNQRSGLYAYFLLHATAFLREGGRLGFVLPNVWLDVDYGAPLKQFLLDHFKLIAVVESDVERWFSDARVNTCLAVLEKCSGPNRRAANRVRLVQLKRPLAHLLPLPADDYRRPQVVEQLVTRLLPGADRR